MLRSRSFFPIFYLMLKLLYPVVRTSRILVTTHAIHHFTDSADIIFITAVITDIVSITIDSRPFFKTWNQFIIAAIFLPWYYENYWNLFEKHSNLNSYLFEFSFTVLYLFLVGEGIFQL